ncbi:MAG: hypothetical protein UT32_C0010G0018 [Parcubacteria group bacterium GW2011_GWC2_39_14]|nr:MAG: hypothetical protein UT32_C0010G0018 [Parcubacteria group bacterium GW2011_GWC2_39_14]KKR55155.1 MAG: hypothetical protein UT91_C0004G0054 [Parcubacteria group bacterium GW2011_GWA2_40_23]
MNELLKNKVFQVAIASLCVLLVFLLGLSVGLSVGKHERGFANDWSDNYHKNFAGPRGGFMQEMMKDQEIINANGVFGQIIKIEGNDLVVKGDKDIEKLIVVGAKTIINRGRETVTQADLKVTDNIVVIGEPNAEGKIEAKLIRVMPAFGGQPVLPPAQIK